MSVVLVINSGSSSIKYQIIEMVTEEVLGKGLIERIGIGNGIATHTGPAGEQSSEQDIPDHFAGMALMMDMCAEYGPHLENIAIVAVAHRVVQGGSRFIGPTIITDTVVKTIDEISSLAPLHNPANLRGISAARQSFPDIPHVAIFDTAFHQTMPADAYTYAIDRDIARRYRIRKYGFHGTSHKYVSHKAAEYLRRPIGDFNAIVLHIGNGASACAIRGGKSVDTSMGMTPLEGLVMGTRSGDIDPAVLMHLHRQAGMTFDDLDDMLNRKSGLLGLSGSSDMRDVMTMMEAGEEAAQLAIDVYCHRLKQYIGGYYAELGRLDAIVWTAGVGEHAPGIRERSLANLEHMGIRLDLERNRQPGEGVQVISTRDSDVTVIIVPTNEELELARQTLEAIENG
jgi:acetate kinase